MSIKTVIEIIENEVCYYKNKLINSYRCDSEVGIIIKVTGGEYSINYDDIEISDFKTIEDVKSLYHEKFKERNFRGNHILDYYFTNDKYPYLSVTEKYNDTIRGNIIVCADLLSEYFKDHTDEIKNKFHDYFKNGMFRKHKLISYHFTPNTNTLIITTNITQYAIPYYELESLYEQITNECRDSEFEKIYTNKVVVAENVVEISSNPVMGYHMTEIEKGELGKLSKIREELDEAIDAEKQQCKIMTLVELSDMMGAIESYLESNFTDITIRDLITMSNITKRAFKAGRR